MYSKNRKIGGGKKPAGIKLKIMYKQVISVKSEIS